MTNKPSEKQKETNGSVSVPVSILKNQPKKTDDQSAIVITSYSIHYTKLYDFTGAGFNHLPAIHYADTVRQVRDGIHVITDQQDRCMVDHISYNFV